MRTGTGRCSRRKRGVTLVEVLLASVLAGLTMSGILYGYSLSARRAEWSAYSLAGQSLAMMRIEQTRACKWDPNGWPPQDFLLNASFPQRVDVLDIPTSGTNLVYATNTTTITQISTAPPLKMIRVDCTWRFASRGLFTNTVVTYRAPDQ